MDDIGLEPKNVNPLSTKALRKIRNQSAAKCGASQINIESDTIDLQKLIAAWPVLPENIKKAVQILIQPFVSIGAD